MDYETLKHFSIVSTSDQVRDFLYPYIAANVLSAVLPEQAAVWSYPVSSRDVWGEVDGASITEGLSDVDNVRRFYRNARRLKKGKKGIEKCWKYP